MAKFVFKFFFANDFLFFILEDWDVGRFHLVVIKWLDHSNDKCIQILGHVNTYVIYNILEHKGNDFDILICIGI